MHEWAVNIHYKTWIAQGWFTNIILTPSKQWGGGGGGGGEEGGDNDWQYPSIGLDDEQCWPSSFLALCIVNIYAALREMS